LSSDTCKDSPEVVVPPEVVAVTVVELLSVPAGIKDIAVGGLTLESADLIILTEPKELDQVEASPPEATFLLV
jgi:hypothetical protein